jgi:hypothetical protein
MQIRAALLSIVTGVVVSASGPAHAVTNEKATFKNTQVALFTSLETPITCAGTGGAGTASAGVFVSGGSFVNPFGSGSGTLLQAFSFFNSCTGETFGEVNGFIVGGITGPNHPLTSATLTGSTTTQTSDEEPQTVSLSLNLTFTGDGTLSVSREATETRTVTGPGGPFTITIQRGAFRNRTADVTGTITIEGVVFPVNVDMGGTLLDNKSSTISVTK